MTVQTSTLRADYTGNGATTSFPIPFAFSDNSHISVYRANVLLTLNSDYTVAGAGVGTGGTLTMATAPGSGVALTILRNVPYTQLTHFVPNDPLPASSLENALDLQTMQNQQQQEALGRAVTLPPGTTGVNVALPAPIPGYALAWDADGTALTQMDPSIIAANYQIATSRANTTATAGQTLFTVPSYTIGINGLLVWLNGALLVPGTDYTETSTTSITLLIGATAGDQLTFLAASPVTALTGISANGVSASSANTVTNKVSVTINGSTYYLLASTSGT